MPATTISPPPPVACSSSKKPWQNPAFPFLPYFPPSRRELYHRAICPRLIAKTKCFPLKFVRVSKIPFPLSSLSFLRFQVRIKPATARQGRSGPTSARTPLSRSICVRPSLPPSIPPPDRDFAILHPPFHDPSRRKRRRRKRGIKRRIVAAIFYPR